MEHNVYVCRWSRSVNGFALWVKSRPQVRGEGPTYADAEEHLIEAIQNDGGAMHAVLEYDRPLSKSILEAKYANPELYLIVGDERFETDGPRRLPSESPEDREDRLRWKDGFFQSPVCRECCYATSRRSRKPLFLKYVPRQFDGAFGYVGRGEGATTLQVLSDGFLDLLRPNERRRLKLRRVKGDGRASRFHELTGPNGPPFVAVAGMEIRGWRCGECGHQTWGYWGEKMAIHSFVAKSDLPRSLDGIFTVGIAPEIELAITADRWKELVGRKGTRGFTSQFLGVVPDREIVRCPNLPKLPSRRATSRSGLRPQRRDSRALK